MITVILVIHILIAIALIALILLQKTEGSATGAGFSAAASVTSMMQPRARPNPLSRATTILGICFFATSLGLALLAKPTETTRSIFETAPVSGAVPRVQDSVVVPEQAPADESPAAETPAEPAVPTVPNN